MASGAFVWWLWLRELQSCWLRSHLHSSNLFISHRLFFLGLTVWSCVFCCTVSNWRFLSFNRLSIDSEKKPICFLFVACWHNFDSLEPQTQLMKRKSFARRSGQNLKLKTSFRFLRRKSTTFSQSNFSERTPSECAGWGGSLPSPSLRLAQVAMSF